MNLDFFNQSVAVNFLINSYRQKRLAHSYIFTGVEGLGKLEIARYFVNLIQCLSPIDSMSAPCGVCKNCRKIEQDIFVDHLEITVPADKTTISIEQIREDLFSFIKYSPNENKYKTCIIYPIEKMRLEAISALLKTLEEPPANFIFILIASNANMLLQTILSRSQIVKFKEQPAQEIEKRLLKYKQLEKTQARTLAVLSAGRIKYALKFAETDILEKRVMLIERMRSVLLERKFFNAHSFANFITANFFKAKPVKDDKNDENTNIRLDKQKMSMALFDIIIHFFRDLAVAKQFDDLDNITNIDYSKELKKIAEKYKIEEIQQIIYNIIKSEKLLYSNAHPLLIFENIFIRGY